MEKSMDYLRRLRTAVTVLKTPSDVEKASRDQLEGGYTIEPLAQSEDLLMFRLLVGIYQDRSFRPPQGFNRAISTSDRPAPNLGVYTTICDKEIKAKKNFKNFSILINFCLGLQLIVAAALTAIGASGKGRASVTVFGAINTIIAGFLTFLKGSGLPNRYKYYQNQWGKVREYTEQKERDLALGRVYVDVHHEVEVIRQMYEDVRADVEANTPERFLGSSSQVRAQMSIATPPQAHLASQPGFDPAKAQNMEQRLVSIMNAIEHKGKDWLHDREKSASAATGAVHHTFTDEVMGLKSKLEGKMHDIQTIEKRLYDEKQAQVQHTTEEMKNLANATIREVGNIEHNIEARTIAAVQQKQNQIRETTRDFLDQKLGSNGEGSSHTHPPS